jgi:hypothetical protein
MKPYLITAAIVAAFSIAIYPFMNHLAYQERGYHAIGGEEMLLIFGLFAAVMIILHGREKTIQKLLREEEAQKDGR